MDRLLKALSDLHETGDQCVSAVRVVVHAVSGHQKSVPVRNRNDHGRGDLRVFRLSTLRADKSTLGLAILHQMSAASAVLSALLETMDLGCRDPCKRLIHRMHLPVRRGWAELIRI